MYTVAPALAALMAVAPAAANAVLASPAAQRHGSYQATGFVCRPIHEAAVKARPPALVWTQVNIRGDTRVNGAEMRQLALIQTGQIHGMQQDNVLIC